MNDELLTRYDNLAKISADLSLKGTQLIDGLSTLNDNLTTDNHKLLALNDNLIMDNNKLLKLNDKLTEDNNRLKKNNACLLKIGDDLLINQDQLMDKLLDVRNSYLQSIKNIMKILQSNYKHDTNLGQLSYELQPVMEADLLKAKRAWSKMLRECHVNIIDSMDTNDSLYNLDIYNIDCRM